MYPLLAHNRLRGRERQGRRRLVSKVLYMGRAERKITGIMQLVIVTYVHKPNPLCPFFCLISIGFSGIIDAAPLILIRQSITYGIMNFPFSKRCPGGHNETARSEQRKKKKYVFCLCRFVAEAGKYETTCGLA